MGGGGVRVEVNEKLKFLGKFTKNYFFFGGGGSGGGVGSGGEGWVGGVGLVGCGHGGCERRIEVFVKIQKKKKLGGGGWSRVVGG